jgi:hypothetical protein
MYKFEFNKGNRAYNTNKTAYNTYNRAYDMYIIHRIYLRVDTYFATLLIRKTKRA